MLAVFAMKHTRPVTGLCYSISRTADHHEVKYYEECDPDDAIHKRLRDNARSKQGPLGREMFKRN